MDIFHHQPAFIKKAVCSVVQRLKIYIFKRKTYSIKTDYVGSCESLSNEAECSLQYFIPNLYL